MLRLLGSPRNFPDLPALWDVVPVGWEAWEKRVPTSLDFHLKGVGQCEGCKLGSSLWQATGFWQRTTMRGEWGKRGMRNFHATRCGWCGHTTVYTAHDDQAWTLDDTDYGPHGSHDIDEQHRLF